MSTVGEHVKKEDEPINHSSVCSDDLVNGVSLAKVNRNASKRRCLLKTLGYSIDAVDLGMKNRVSPIRRT